VSEYIFLTAPRAIPLFALLWRIAYAPPFVARATAEVGEVFDGTSAENFSWYLLHV